MKINEEGINLIKYYEKCKLEAYKALPTEKYYTIGWGHYGEDVLPGMKLTQEQADELFRKDLEKFEKYVTSNTKGLNLNVNQFSALVSFTYNCGAGNLRKLVLGRTISQIADKMLDFNHAGGKVHSGLTKRRQKERELFLKPVEEEKMKYIIGSARIDEDGKVQGGKAGDQKQKSTPDYSGEVSLQDFYIHNKNWYVFRPKDPSMAADIAGLMRTACNNPNIGYNQAKRLEIVKYGIFTTTPCACDCSSLIREIVKEASGKDPGNFTTANEYLILDSSGLFESKVLYKKGMDLYEGDILVTTVKGHTAAVVEGYKRILNLENNVKVESKKSGIKLEITMPLIKLGSKGLAVEIWQKLMGDLYIISEFDEDVKARTMEWQKAHGLEVDGIVGKNSWTEGFKQV